jgi:hypothetical protein
MELIQISTPPTPPTPPEGSPATNLAAWAQYSIDWAKYTEDLAVFQRMQQNIGLVISPSQIVLGGRPDIPPGTGVEGPFGSRFNEIHQPVPGMKGYSDTRGPDQIGAWVDANTGLLRFDRLPDGSRLAGRFQNSNGGQYNGYFPPINKKDPVLPPDDKVTTPVGTNPILPPDDKVTTPVGTNPVLPVNPPVIISPPAPTPPPPPPPTVRTINLRDLVTLSAYTIDRQYIKGTLRDIPKEKIRVSNNSSEVDITVTMLGLAGVSFNPHTFDLPKASSIDVDVLFDPTVIDSYPEGVSAVNCVVNLTSNSAIFDPLPPPPPTPPAPPQPQPLPPVLPPFTPTPSTPITPTPTPSTPIQEDGWVERRYGPSQLSQAGIPRPINANRSVFESRQIQPELVRTIPEIAYANGELPAPYFITWGKLINLQQGRRYKFDVRTDDGMRVFVDGRLVLDAWRDQPPTTYTFYVDGLSGLRSIFIEYYNDRGIGTATVQWQLATSEVVNVVYDEPPPPPIFEPPIQILSPPPPPPPVPLPPPTPPVTTVWVDGTGAGGLSLGLPPAGWVQDPFGGAWYPPNDPYVLRDFDRAARPTTIVSAIDGSRGTFDPSRPATTTNTTVEVINPVPPVLIAPPPPPPPPPPVPQVFIVEQPTFFNDFSNDTSFGTRDRFVGGGGFTLEDQFLI